MDRQACHLSSHVLCCTGPAFWMSSKRSLRLLPVDFQLQMRSEVGGVAPAGSLVLLMVKFSLKGGIEWPREMLEM